MPLISCPECNQSVSSQANICPHCGYRLKMRRLQNDKKKAVFAAVLSSLILGAVPLHKFYQGDIKNGLIRSFFWMLRMLCAISIYVKSKGSNYSYFSCVYGYEGADLVKRLDPGVYYLIQVMNYCCLVFTVVGIIEAIIYYRMTEDDYRKKYVDNHKFWL